MAKISVIIPAYNASKSIAQTIFSIKAQQGLDHEPEIIVVDDGSQDNTLSVLKNFAGIKIISQKNSGPAAARNKGAYNSDGDILVFTDSDTVPKPDWLKELTVPFKKENAKAATGTYQIENVNSPLAELIQREIELKHNNYDKFVLFGGSYNLAITKDLFMQVGGFNEEYKTASGEDNELCYSLARAGYKIRFVPTAVVGHYHPEKIKKYLETQYKHGFWRAKLYYTFPNRVKGDDYTGKKEILETLLSVFLILFNSLWFICYLFNSNKHKKTFEYLSLLSSIMLIITEFKATLPLYAEVKEEKKDKLPALICAVGVFIGRSLCRTLGFIAGLCYFMPAWFRKKHGKR